MHRLAHLCRELKACDFDSRLLIAAHLLRASIPVVLGQVWTIAANAKARLNLPGCYLLCTANQVQAAAMQWAADAGHAVMTAGEEALPLVDPLVNISGEALKVCRNFRTDSDAHRAIVERAFPQHAAKFIVTGSARLEAMRTADLEGPGGSPYALFNTGFSLVNSLWGDVRAALAALQSGLRSHQKKRACASKWNARGLMPSKP